MLIIEPRAHGHHFSLYLRSILREGLARGWRIVLLTTRDAIEHRAAQSLSDELGSRVEIALMPTPRQIMFPGSIALLCNQWFYVRACVEGWRRIGDRRFDAVLMMDLDSADKVIATVGSPFESAPLCGVLVHAKAHRLVSPIGLRAGLLRQLFLRLLGSNSVRAVFVIDSGLIELRERLPVASANKLVIVAEPAAAEPRPIDRVEAQRLLGLDGASLVVLVYGAHSRRKGLHFLLDAVAGMARREVTVVLAGQVDAEVEAQLSGAMAQSLVADGRLQVISRFVSDAEEGELLSAADVVWLGYAAEFDGQSALLPLAASYSVPVIARVNTPVGDMVQQHGLGLVLTPEDRGAVVQALRRLSTQTELREGLRHRARIFADSRPMRGFAGAICAAVLDS